MSTQQVYRRLAQIKHHLGHKVRQLHPPLRNRLPARRQQPNPKIHNLIAVRRLVKQSVPQHLVPNRQAGQIHPKEHLQPHSLAKISPRFLPDHHRQLRLLRRQPTLLLSEERLRAQLRR